MALKGYAMVVTIAVGLVLLLLSLGFLNKRVMEYRGAYQTAYQTQALALARAGLEDARIKLCKDGKFPPNTSDDQRSFSYTEEVTANEESYTVILDTTLKESPYAIVRVTSIGTAGPMGAPIARRKIVAELDVSPEVRTGPPGVANPNFYQWVNWQDFGAR